MIKKFILPCLCKLLASAALCQVNESFSDGDFNNNPVWNGNTADWIVNSSRQLQSNNSTANSSFYLSTANRLANNTQWEFFVHLNFNTSSLNYVDAYLISSALDLGATSTSGYFVRIGGSKDNISLYRKDADGSISQLITGAGGITNKTDNILKIKVTRSAYQFTLYCDVSGSGNNYVSEGTSWDNTYNSSAYFGFLVKQSTSSFFQKHFFDDILIQPYSAINEFLISRVNVVSATAIDLFFSQPLDAISAQSSGNFLVNNGIGRPVTSQVDPNNSALIHLNFSNSFLEKIVYTISLNNIMDVNGDMPANKMADFTYSPVQQYDVVIDEIMADPNPVVGLPDAEFLELKNISGKSINLSGWTIGTDSKTSNSFPDFDLPADSFLILCSHVHVNLFQPYGNVLDVPGFPAIPNSGGILWLKNEQGKTIHAVDFNTNWYQNTLKSSGGWSLEMIDTHNPCEGSNNWKSSTDASGGSPGRKNSIDALNADGSPPQLLRSYSIGNNAIVLLFNEPLDSTSAANISAYTMDGNITVLQAIPLGPLFNRVQIILDHPMNVQKTYMVMVRDVMDCAGNAIGVYNNTQTGIPVEALPSDVVINEILFDPKPDASDYIELYNRSNKILDAGKIYIGNRNPLGSISSIKKITDSTFLFFPDSYLVVTSDAYSLKQNYLVKDPSSVIENGSLPAFPNDKGTVVLLDVQQNIIDEVTYSKDWQFPLITDPKGVSLERIDPSGKSQDQNNWHSAASTVGFGTPTYKNSQFKQVTGISGSIDVSPKVFSPDNDGLEDITTISYQLPTGGYVANIMIFDANGRQVRYLVKNNLLGLKGSWIWDGLDEYGQKLPIGVYIIFAELFNLQGQKKEFKNLVVLTRKN